MNFSFFTPFMTRPRGSHNRGRTSGAQRLQEIDEAGKDVDALMLWVLGVVGFFFCAIVGAHYLGWF